MAQVYQSSVIKKLNLFCLPQIFLIGLAGVLTSCSREDGDSGNKSKISISLPTTYSSVYGQNKLGTLSNDPITYIAINVTGDKMNPIFYFWENCGECMNGSTAPESFEIDVPNGKNRLLQVLFVREDDESSLIFYGDESFHAQGGETEIELSVSELSNNDQVSGHIAGRYLTGTNSGPTGDVDVIFEPPGNKPPMVVFKEKIYQGWFKFRALSSTKFSYIVRPWIPSEPAITLWGTPQNLRNFTPGDQVARISFPVHERKLIDDTYIDEDAFILTAGFWADNSTFLSGKKVCTSGFSNVNAGSLSKFNSTSSPLVFKTSGSEYNDSALRDTGTPLTEVRVKGGVVDSGCSFEGVDAFGNELWVRSSMLDGESKDSFLGFDGVFKYAQVRLTPTEKNLLFDVDSGTYIQFTAKIIPGLHGSLVKGVRYFKRELPPNSFILFPNCANPTGEGWAAMGSGCSLNFSDSTCEPSAPAESFSESTGVLVCAYFDEVMTEPIPWASRMIRPEEIPEP